MLHASSRTRWLIQVGSLWSLAARAGARYFQAAKLKLRTGSVCELGMSRQKEEWRLERQGVPILGGERERVWMWCGAPALVAVGEREEEATWSTPTSLGEAQQT
jgi:hypothetical protein